MTDNPKDAKGKTADAVEQGRRFFLGGLASDKSRTPTPAPAPSHLPPSPQQAAKKPEPESARDARPTTPAPKPDVYPRPHGERKTPRLPLGIMPEGGASEDTKPTIIPAKPKPAPGAFVTEAETPDNLVSALFNATNGDTRHGLMMEASQGVPMGAIAMGIAPMEHSSSSEISVVERNVDYLKTKIPPRFIPYIDSAMGVLAKNMKGNEPLIKIMMADRRWTREQEERLGGAVSAASDELQRIFKKMYRDEGIRRIKSREELVGRQDPGEVEKQFAYAILSSKHFDANHETNVFDAFAKGAMFVFLSQQRPRTFMYVLGHPEVSKPYAVSGGAEGLGGVEGLGVMLGLDLPDPKTTNMMPNPLIGLGFRLYSEVHLSTLAGWLVAVSSKWPKPQTGGRFEHMVKQDVDEFQKAVVDSGFSTEKFFQLLSRDDHSKMRQDPDLIRIFGEAAKGKPGSPLIYGNADDIFDAAEAIVGYMNMLKHDKTARALFLDSYLSNYPIGKSGGSFYKMFGMCLFNEEDDIKQNKEIVEAFQSDPDPRVQVHIRLKLNQFQEAEKRKAERSKVEDGKAAPDSGEKSEEDFGGLDFEGKP